MNIDISEIDGDQEHSAEEQDGEPAAKPGRGTFALAFVAFLIALAALLAAGWTWWQGEASTDSEEARSSAEIARLESNDGRLSSQLKALQEALDSRPAGVDAGQLQDLRSSLADDQEQRAALQKALQEQAALARSLQSAVDALHGRLLAAETALANVEARNVDAGGELDLSEVDYLLRLASERLQLFADPLNADRALAMADAQLAALANPAHLGVRQAIAAARNDLAALNLPDELAIAGQLDAIQKSIPGLPFRPASAAAPSDTPSPASGWWAKLKETLGSLVTVRRSTDEENRRISLQDKDYIRQRVWLQLEVAHLALMRRDQEAFHGALQRVQASLDEWFDSASSEVTAVEQSLDALSEVDLDVAWPDISKPWNMLRLVRGAQPAVAPAERPPSPENTPAGNPPESAPAADENSGTDRQ